MTELKVPQNEETTALLANMALAHVEIVSEVP
eukprot:CAMPEP_0197671508 /NCGR_PEP_ID=MMETSP1338-20131121/76820_1 /TAXON_ID=43686 ORGANISM="Pelagodinium beii, Strain RCC1491" /NCGR_SAMPLE_ID=MMETSP1338 /ASSEMBLY_ACC=CAM_ASM_000754 /LENGTH=31 /DNA_ID= /DNA_START= /DNA_END= /DNA_ORIENTATION=